MKRLSIIFALFASLLMAGCGGIQREPRDAYMPDMAYSRAYETYADHSILNDSGIFYNNMPVPGTVSRSQELVFHIPKDSLNGDTTNYVASKAVKNPITFLTGLELQEAERLYLIQCAICHNTDLKGGGPLNASGKFTSRPISFLDAKYKAMPEGQMFYSVTYGKNQMGPYGPQLSTKQRWMIIYYIKQQQAKGGAAADSAAVVATAGKDTVGAAQK
jgi:hypothetical protein